MNGIPCITSGGFIRYQSKPGQQDIKGKRLCPMKGALRCMANAIASPTKSLSLNFGDDLVHCR